MRSICRDLKQKPKYSTIAWSKSENFAGPNNSVLVLFAASMRTTPTKKKVDTFKHANSTNSYDNNNNKEYSGKRCREQAKSFIIIVAFKKTTKEPNQPDIYFSLLMMILLFVVVCFFCFGFGFFCFYTVSQYPLTVSLCSSLLSIRILIVLFQQSNKNHYQDSKQIFDSASIFSSVQFKMHFCCVFSMPLSSTTPIPSLSLSALLSIIVNR